MKNNRLKKRKQHSSDVKDVIKEFLISRLPSLCVGLGMALLVALILWAHAVHNVDLSWLIDDGLEPAPDVIMPAGIFFSAVISFVAAGDVGEGFVSRISAASSGVVGYFLGIFIISIIGLLL